MGLRVDGAVAHGMDFFALYKRMRYRKTMQATTIFIDAALTARGRP